MVQAVPADQEAIAQEGAHLPGAQVGLLPFQVIGEVHLQDFSDLIEDAPPIVANGIEAPAEGAAARTRFPEPPLDFFFRSGGETRFRLFDQNAGFVRMHHGVVVQYRGIQKKIAGTPFFKRRGATTSCISRNPSSKLIKNEGFRMLSPPGRLSKRSSGERGA